MNDYAVTVVTRGEELPPLSEGNFFHSSELFRLVERSPGNTPYMAIASDRGGRVVGQLLVVTRRRGAWIPPYLYTHAHAYGEGEYAPEVNAEQVFGLLLDKVTLVLRRRLCLYIEFSDLSHKMFGYRYFRREGYYPMLWQEIHNSLHSMPPCQRLSRPMLKRLERLERRGITTHEVESPEDLHDFYHVMRRYYRLKIRRYLPPREQFEAMRVTRSVRLFVTRYKGKAVGGCACVYSQGNAYLWFLAAKRRYPHLHLARFTVWKALNYAHEHHYEHMFFMDVGLPWRRNPFRDFILSFGGKPVSTYRWFRFSISWVNSLLRWLHRE